jgi:hypothetical protein
MSAPTAVPNPPRREPAPALTPTKVKRPIGLSVDEILKLKAPERKMLVESLVSTPGALMLYGAQKAGKTILATQIAIAIASGQPLMGNYRVCQKGPVIFVEKDDPAGALSIRDYLKASPIPVTNIPLHVFADIPFSFGPQFCSWLESEIIAKQARCVVLDSYTALRPHRKPGCDIVKIESEEIGLLDALAKKCNCTIIILNHVSRGSIGMDWSDQGVGTFSQSAAVEGQIHLSRFKELPGNARERLLQGRPRHADDFAAVIRFRVQYLDYEVVIEGPAAPHFPEILAIRTAFQQNGKPTEFAPKQLYHDLGMSRSTAMRIIATLHSANALIRVDYGQYRLAAGVFDSCQGVTENTSYT